MSSSVTAVASGAVLRALNKDQGPQRIARSSYGILRDEPFDQDLEEHKGVKATTDKFDGELYVTATIDWLLKKASRASVVGPGRRRGLQEPAGNRAAPSLDVRTI